MLHDLLCTIPPSSCVAKLEDSKPFQGRYEYTGEMGSISKISTGKSHLASKMFILKLPIGYPSLCAYRCVKVSLLLWDSAFSSGEPWASASTFMLSLVEIHGNVVPGNMTNTINKQHYLARLLISQPHLELGRLPSCNCRIIWTPTCVKYKLSNTWSLSTWKPASPRFDRFRRLQWQTSFHGEAWPFGAKELLETVPAARHGGKGMEWRRVTSDWK